MRCVGGSPKCDCRIPLTEYVIRVGWVETGILTSAVSLWIAIGRNKMPAGLICDEAPPTQLVGAVHAGHVKLRVQPDSGRNPVDRTKTRLPWISQGLIGLGTGEAFSGIIRYLQLERARRNTRYNVRRGRIADVAARIAISVAGGSEEGIQQIRVRIGAVAIVHRVVEPWFA